MTAVGFGTIGASRPATPAPTPTPSTVTVTEPVKPVGTEAGVSGVPKMKLGVNLEKPTYYGGARVFSNLMLQSYWALKSSTSSSQMPAEKMDRDQNLIQLAAGEQASRAIGPATNALRGLSVDIICRWAGKAKIEIRGKVARNIRISGSSLTFTFVPDGNNSAEFVVSGLDTANPIRDIDCRETDADPNAIYDPAFLADAARYDTLRLMKWQSAVESNAVVTWANRTKTTANSYATVDGVPIERMILLANLIKRNIWLCIPWNANEEYIHKFAEYVRDNLDPSLVAYVELSNEVWNTGYKVTQQAREEGLAENLATDSGLATLYRYAERTAEVMDVWKSVFATNPRRIVRVLATQNAVPWGAKVTLAYKDTASKVDALATAPYFSRRFAAGEQPPADFFSNGLLEAMNLKLANAAENKALATERGLRYITYEAGQHITISNDADIPMLAQLQRDPRMGDLYTRYLMKWKDDFGDLMVLFHAWGPINRYGAWGMQEYLGQPLSEAPKARAVDLFRQSYLTKN
ncbi:MAG: hypothetical protein BGP16_07005 [Sphingobium sp. 66-54]|nr:MAG: hypothetical protein BGP16_07005 [Sphingobium sp. 66-54]